MFKQAKLRLLPFVDGFLILLIGLHEPFPDAHEVPVHQTPLQQVVNSFEEQSAALIGQPVLPNPILLFCKAQGKHKSPFNSILVVQTQHSTLFSPTSFAEIFTARHATQTSLECSDNSTYFVIELLKVISYKKISFPTCKEDSTVICTQSSTSTLHISACESTVGSVSGLVFWGAWITHPAELVTIRLKNKFTTARLNISWCLWATLTEESQEQKPAINWLPMINNLLEMMKSTQIQNIGKSNLILHRRLKIVFFFSNSTLKMKVFKQPSPAFWCIHRREESARQCPARTNGILKSNTDISCTPQIKDRHGIQLAQAKLICQMEKWGLWQESATSSTTLAPAQCLNRVRGSQSTSTAPKSCTGTRIPLPRDKQETSESSWGVSRIYLISFIPSNTRKRIII